MNTALPKIGCPESSGLKDKGHLSVCAVMHSMVVAITVVTFKWPRHSHGVMRHQPSASRRQSNSALRPRTGLQTIETASHAVVARAGSNVTMPLPEMNTGGNTQLREGHLLDTSYRHQIEMISPPSNNADDIRWICVPRRFVLHLEGTRGSSICTRPAEAPREFLSRA